LTHPFTPEAPPIEPRLSLPCEISNVTIKPAKTALLVIDMQNITLSSAYCPAPPIRFAEQALLDYAIAATPRNGIRFVWLNWGLTQEELENVTPAEVRVFGSKAQMDRRTCDLIDENTILKCIFVLHVLIIHQLHIYVGNSAAVVEPDAAGFGEDALARARFSAF
jgi:hypothetical protein